jgi:hypothetical protein
MALLFRVHADSRMHSAVSSARLRPELLSQNAAAAPVAERATQQSLVSFNAAPQAEDDEAQRRATVLAAEEQALRDRSVKVQLAQDVARLQLARQRLAAVIHRPSALKVCVDGRGVQHGALLARGACSFSTLLRALLRRRARGARARLGEPSSAEHESGRLLAVEAPQPS